MASDLEKKLLQLRDPSHPLLIKLRKKSPWTHFHSLLVWDVASYSCLNFKNANPLLIVVWAMFHDIWKMIHPFAYAENQEDGEYPFMPEYIKDHVKMWIEMAKAFNLPEEVVRFIKTHHWTSFAPSENKKNQQVYDMSEKPVSVEETLVMLADSCEAAIRWYRWEYTKDNIRSVIESVFLQKEQNDQLRSSVLISADFKQVADDYTDSFYFVHHRRFATESAGGGAFSKKQI